jgi:hypothetical protein
MSMEQWWSDTDRGKPKYSEKNLSHCHFVPHKSHTDWPGIEPGCNMNYIYIFSSYRAVNTPLSVMKTSQLMLYSEIIAVCSEIHTEHINTVRTAQ